MSLPQITTLDEAASIIAGQHEQIVWLTAAVRQLQGLFGVSPNTTPGQRIIQSDPNRTEVGMGPLPSADKTSFL